MTIRQIDIFLALCITPNMREVAQDFYLSQAAVSSSLSSFELELGVLLFERVNNRLVLNEKGKFLAKKLRPIHSQLKEVLNLVGEDSVAGNLKVGASTTLADFIMPQIIYDFHKKYRDVQINCESGNTAKIIRHIEDGGYDIGFVEGSVRNIDVLVTPILQEELVVVSSSKEFATERAYKLEELMDKEWLLREKGSAAREFILSKVHTMGLKIKHYMEFNHYDPIKILLKNNDTLACLSQYIIQRELEAGELFPVKISDVELVRTLSRVEHKDKKPSVLVELLSEAIELHIKPQKKI